MNILISDTLISQFKNVRVNIKTDVLSIIKQSNTNAQNISLDFYSNIFELWN